MSLRTTAPFYEYDKFEETEDFPEMAVFHLHGKVWRKGETKSKCNEFGNDFDKNIENILKLKIKRQQYSQISGNL